MNKRPTPTATKENAPARARAESKKITSNLNDNSTEAQRQRLLERLRTGPLSTIEARRDLDILMPAARVHELRHRDGWNIQTLRIPEETECGKKHNVALYVLHS